MIDRIIRKIKNIFLNRYTIFPAFGEDKMRILNLRKSVSQIDFIEETTTEWLDNQKKLKDLIQTQDPRNFIKWPMIRYTMFYVADKSEYDNLVSSPRWKSLYSNKITEDKVGNPPRYIHNISSSGNLVHHVYALEQLYLSIPNFDISKLSTIFEFGGGYGSLCRVCYRLGYSGRFEIFDFQIFLELQKYFILSSLGLNIFNKVKFINKSKLITSTPDLFLALWSISESPLDLRNEIWTKVGKPKYILIGYQFEFSGIDNLRYFETLKNSMSDYNWSEHDIEHIKGNKYLVGIRNF